MFLFYGCLFSPPLSTCILILKSYIVEKVFLFCMKNLIIQTLTYGTNLTIKTERQQGSI